MIPPPESSITKEQEKDHGASLLPGDASASQSGTEALPDSVVPASQPERLVRLTREDDYEKRWIVVGQHGAIDFHCSHAHLEVSRKYGVTGGVEYHHRRPASYMGEDYGCTHDHCWILGGKCWHDGTSLGASEHWIPLLNACGEGAIWRELEITYRKREWPEIGSGNQLTNGNSLSTRRSEAQKTSVTDQADGAEGR